MSPGTTQANPFEVSGSLQSNKLEEFCEYLGSQIRAQHTIFFSEKMNAAQVVVSLLSLRAQIGDDSWLSVLNYASRALKDPNLKCEAFDCLLRAMLQSPLKDAEGVGLSKVQSVLIREMREKHGNLLHAAKEADRQTFMYALGVYLGVACVAIAGVNFYESPKLVGLALTGNIDGDISYNYSMLVGGGTACLWSLYRACSSCLKIETPDVIVNQALSYILKETLPDVGERDSR